MSKKGSKQATLFQSWGSKKKEPQSPSEPRPSTSAAQVHSHDDEVIDLCGSFDDGDDDILCEAEETVSTSFNKSADGSSTFLNRSKNEHTPSKNNFREDGLKVEEDICNISIGASACLTPTQKQTQGNNLPGFDRAAGKLWIYPTNYPIRDYQFNIVHQGLFKNTMVTLPTGLGKTFIAAVVMYNFYRWYPQCKVVFMAPTKPLVAQQIEACYNIMGIPQNHTAEMTGSMGPSKRETAWHEKRVFFLTPQVLTNDLSRGTCPADLVKCLVIDEAHKALGNHAYCQVVRELVKFTERFRILALSATPGSDIKAVQQVLSNLLISHIEIRTEESIDIKQYSHHRKVDKIVVPLGEELSKVKTKYIHIMEVVVNKLKKHGVLYNRDTTNLSKFMILKAREAFRQNPPERLPRSQYGVVEGDFAMAMSLYHGYELLQLHGSRSLHNFLEGILTGDKSHGRTRTEQRRSANFNELMEMLSGKHKTPDDLTASQVAARPFVTGHPKMEKLQEIVLDHFNSHTDGPTRVMIFSQYRDSVQEITDMLHVHQPLIMVMSFIGQASTGKNTKGFTQKEQLKVMKQFREGGYNTLVSTCVGEEGLDIGDVDLIICFDAHKSPIRLVQRMGRTGRKREGRIVMLVTQGKEEQIYNQSQYSKKSIHKAILNGAKSLHFYEHSQRMVPDHYHPTCHKMHITIKENFKPTKKLAAVKEVKPKINAVWNDGSKKEQTEEIITLEEYRELEPWLVPEHEIPKLPALNLMCLPGRNEHEQASNGALLSLDGWSPWQNTLQDTLHVDHGLASKHLVDIMEFVQLQQTLEPGDDPYGLEMAAYLNDEDVTKDGETADGHVSILKYCVEKPSLGKEPSTTAIAPKKSGNTRVRKRLSDALPKFAFEPDVPVETDDDDLPEFGGANVSFHKRRLGAAESNEAPTDTDKYDSDESVDIEAVKRNIKAVEQTCKEALEVLDISDEDEDACQIQRKVREKSNNKGKKLMKSKAKSLERKMNEGKLRKRKKSRHSSGQRSIVELIADSDSNDFDDIGTDHGISQKIEEIEHNNEHSNQNEAISQEGINNKKNNSGNGHDIQGKDHVSKNSIDSLTEGSVRIRTPPPIEDAVRLCEALDNETDLHNLDLIEVIDDWHKENAEGKYIVYPEGYNKSCMEWSFNSNSKLPKISLKNSLQKCPIAKEDILVHRSNNKEIQSNSSPLRGTVNMDKQGDVSVDKTKEKCGVDISSKTLKAISEERLSVEKNAQLLIKGNRKKLFKSPINNHSKQKETFCEVTLKSTDCNIIPAKEDTKIPTTPISKNVTQKDCVNLNENKVKLPSDDEDWMNTGSFAMDLELVEKDTSLGDELMDNNCILSPENNEELNDSLEKIVMKNVTKTEEIGVNRNKNEVPGKAALIGNKSPIVESRTSEVNSNRSQEHKHKSLFELCDKTEINSSDETDTLNDEKNNMQVPFSKSKQVTEEHDSWPCEEMDNDDDLFLGVKTPTVKQAINTSTQITFTQALDFVHSSTSGSESCYEGHVVSKSIDNRAKSTVKIKDIQATHTAKTDDSTFTENTQELYDDEEEVLSKVDDENIIQSTSKNIKTCVINENANNQVEYAADMPDREDRDKKSFSQKSTTYINNKNTQKLVSRKSSTSSEEGVELPIFDLGFDLDDDIIPPSPEVKLPLKSAGIRLSQTFSSKLSQIRCTAADETSNYDMTGKLVDNSDKQKLNAKQCCDNTDKIELKVPKSKKSLKLDGVGIRNHVDKTPLKLDGVETESSKENEEQFHLIDDEESQSILDNVSMKRNSISATRTHGLNKKKRSTLDVIPENRPSVKNNEKLCSKSKLNSTPKYLLERNESFSEKANERNKHESTEREFGNFETSFSLLDDDFDDWVDGSVKTKGNDKSVDIEHITKSQKSHRKICSEGRTPVAMVAPLVLSQETKSLAPSSVTSRVKFPEKRTSNCRKSVFKMDDLSPDFFDDSFNFSTNELTVGVMGTPTVLSSHSLRHSTSTPLGSSVSRKVQSVTPFQANENSPISGNLGGKSKYSPENSSSSFESEPLLKELDENSHISENVDTKSSTSVTRYSTSHNSDECESGLTGELDKDVAVITDNDDSFVVVRKKKKVAIIDSPASQRQGSWTDKTKGEGERSSELDCGKYDKHKVQTQEIVISSDDECDDDFDDNFMLTQNNYVVEKPEQPVLNADIISDDDDFEESVVILKPRKPNKTNKSKQLDNKPNSLKAKKKRSSNPFIEEEAELSDDDDDDVEASSDESDGSHLDQYENSFIQDSQCSQSQAMNNTDVHALYLKSVKSPVGNRGRFKLQYKHRDVDVYSQAPPPEDSHYMEDSFCVGSEADDDWLLGEGEDEDNEEECPREVTMLHTDNSVMQTGRKRRRKGMTSFLTSRQRAIQQGRMIALDKIRSKLAGKNTNSNQRPTPDTDTTSVMNNIPKKTRIQVLNDSSSEDESVNHSLNKLDNTNTINLSKHESKGKKRARFLMSSDDSENEDFIEARSSNKCSKNDKSLLSFAKDSFIARGKSHCSDRPEKADHIDQEKLERLRRQKEKQEEFKRNMKSSETHKIGSTKGSLTKIKDKDEMHDRFLKPRTELLLGDNELLLDATRRSKLPGKPVIHIDSRNRSTSHRN